MFTISLLEAFRFNVFPITIYKNINVVLGAVTPRKVQRGCYTTFKNCPPRQSSIATPQEGN